MGSWQCSGLSAPRNGRFYPGTPRSWSAWGPSPPARAQRAPSPVGGTQVPAVKPRWVCLHTRWEQDEVLAGEMSAQHPAALCPGCAQHLGIEHVAGNPAEHEQAVLLHRPGHTQPCHPQQGTLVSLVMVAQPFAFVSRILFWQSQGNKKKTFISALYILINSNFYHRLRTSSSL